MLRGLIERDLTNALNNLRAWRKERDTYYARTRIALWEQEIDRLLDLYAEGR